MKTKLKNENQNQELDVDDQMLLCHLAIICNQMITQAILFDWTQGDPHNTSSNPTGNRYTSAGAMDAPITPPNVETERMQEYRENITSFMLDRIFPLDAVQLLIDAIF